MDVEALLSGIGFSSSSSSLRSSYVVNDDTTRASASLIFPLWLCPQLGDLEVMSIREIPLQQIYRDIISTSSPDRRKQIWDMTKCLRTLRSTHEFRAMMPSDWTTREKDCAEIFAMGIMGLG